MTFVIVANAVAAAVCVGLLAVVMRNGYVVASRSPLAEREPMALPVEQRDTLERAA
jgi:hypothetical protein